MCERACGVVSRDCAGVPRREGTCGEAGLDDEKAEIGRGVPFRSVEGSSGVPASTGSLKSSE